jgi:hypothetical protein
MNSEDVPEPVTFTDELSYRYDVPVNFMLFSN